MGFLLNIKGAICSIFCNKPYIVTYYEDVDGELIMFATCPKCGHTRAVIKKKEV